MRVAICVSGLMRTFLECYESLLQHVIVPNQADLFISTWGILGTGTYKVPGQPWIPVPGEEHPLDPNQVPKAYGSHLKDFEVEEWQPLQNRFHQELEVACSNASNHHSDIHKGITRRLISMHYKVGRANELRKKYETLHGFNYDVIIRARPDIKHYGTLRMSDFDIRWPNCFLDINHSYGYASDQFAFGVPQAVDHYCSIYPKIYDYNRWLAVYNAENMMKYHLVVNGIDIKYMDLQYKVLGLSER